jgi:hypothetical protein
LRKLIHLFPVRFKVELIPDFLSAKWKTSSDIIDNRYQAKYSKTP